MTNSKRKFNLSVTFLEPHYEQLVSTLFSRPGLEGAAYVLCGVSRTPEEERLLVREVIPVAEEHYLVRAPLRLSIRSDSYVSVAKRARETKQSILFAHSHTNGLQEFSPQDDREEPELMKFFSKMAPENTHGAIVLSSPESVRARVTREDAHEIIGRVRVIGRRFRFFDPPIKDDPPLPNFFDRQVLAFGPEVQRLLKRIHVGIVGVGGTGSAVLEQLARLGIGTFSVFDHDVFDNSNVNRVYGSSVQDAGRPKVDIAEDLVREIGLDTIVRRFPEGIGFENSAKALRDCDIVFGCTDKEAPRATLTQLSLRYLIPIFDVGTIIDSKDGIIRGVFGRVTTFFPGEACLFCRRRISAETIRLEGLSKEERKSLAAEGYAPELATDAPAVIIFTTAVATQAVSEFLHRITGFMESDRKTTEVLFRFHETAVGKNREAPNGNCICSQKKFWGRGDSRSFLDVTWPTEPNQPK